MKLEFNEKTTIKYCRLFFILFTDFLLWQLMSNIMCCTFSKHINFFQIQFFQNFSRSTLQLSNKYVTIRLLLESLSVKGQVEHMFAIISTYFDFHKVLCVSNL